jgi:hypothetical protein
MSQSPSFLRERYTGNAHLMPTPLQRRPRQKRMTA